MPLRSPLIDIRCITHRYKRHGPTTLSEVSLHVASGERLAIMGRSGCGKSTLLQFMAGLVSPTTGEICFATRQDGQTSIRCTLMFQRPLLFPWLDVAGNVKLALHFDGATRQATERVDALLAKVGLSARAQAHVRELSGGEQQRVALARSLAIEPDVLLLDEPFSALDPLTRADLRQQLRETQTSFGFAMTLVTHDVDDVLDLATRVVVMAAEPGRIVAEYSIPQDPDPGLRAVLRAQLIDALEPEPLPLAFSA